MHERQQAEADDRAADRRQQARDGEDLDAVLCDEERQGDLHDRCRAGPEDRDQEQRVRAHET
ncbi:hypothetical protein COO01_31530, partial [Bacillus toyonensis]